MTGVGRVVREWIGWLGRWGHCPKNMRRNDGPQVWASGLDVRGNTRRTVSVTHSLLYTSWCRQPSAALLPGPAPPGLNPLSLTGRAPPTMRPRPRGTRWRRGVTEQTEKISHTGKSGARLNWKTAPRHELLSALLLRTISPIFKTSSYPRFDK